MEVSLQMGSDKLGHMTQCIGCMQSLCKSKCPRGVDVKDSQKKSQQNRDMMRFIHQEYVASFLKLEVLMTQVLHHFSLVPRTFVGSG